MSPRTWPWARAWSVPIKLLRKFISGDLPPRSKGQDYIQLNLREYSRREVRYSWKPRNLDQIQAQLISRGFRVKFIPKSSWLEHWYVRGGSICMLEDALEVYLNHIKIADITPTKLIALKSHLTRLGLNNYYGAPISRAMLGLMLILLALLGLVLAHG